MKTIPSNDTNLQNQTPRLIALSALAVLLLLALTGCKNNSRPVAAEIDPVGDYALVSVDGKSTPCSMRHEGAALTVKSGRFTFETNGSCRSLITFSVPSRGDMNRTVDATYTRQGTTLTMHWQGAGMTIGEINGNQFTMTNEGMVFGYQK